jgi:UDP-N-acetylglucosamine--N-acetylmuramyl-(pentapeptide) pyrophosphoryl-undecaprenol N-acetylglucosamine transferase
MDRCQTASEKPHYIFAGGGTGGQIYPAIAVAQQIKNIDPDADITFFCSNRPIDSHILSKTPFEFIALDAKSPSPRPDKLISFLISLKKCYSKAKKHLSGRSVVIGTGGFVSVPIVLAASRMKLPISLINVDIVPGKANKMLARFADEIFLQFEDTKKYFPNTKAKLTVTGCPLREDFFKPNAESMIGKLNLDKNKKTLLITGASSGSVSINNAIASIIDQLDKFKDSWQIVHLTGRANIKDVQQNNRKARIDYHTLDYCDEMQDLYAAADIILGRGGAVSIAEFTAAEKPVICLPYPYHKDNHQARNAATLCKKGAALIIDDTPKTPEKTQAALAKILIDLMTSEESLNKMTNAAKNKTPQNATKTIAETITS